MRTCKSLVTLAGLLILGFTMTMPQVRAGDSDQLTQFQFTFAKPVEVPGKVLPAGTYWFVILDAQGAQNDQAQNTIQIRGADNKTTVAVVLARPIQRKGDGYGTSEPSSDTDKVELTVAQGTGNRPETLLKWFYPGTFTGHQFVYSEQEQGRLDEEPNQTVVLKAQKGTQGYSATLEQ